MRRPSSGRAPPRPTREARAAAQDGALLSRLEHDGRISYSELGEAVGLSKSPAWERVRALESRGAITGYRAVIDPAAVGLQIHAFVQVTIRSSCAGEFEHALAAHPSVLECFSIAGQADYLLHVLVADVASLDTLLRSEIARLPGVERLSTMVGMKTIKARGYIMDCAARARGSG